MTPMQTYLQRLNKLAGELEGLDEDMASDATDDGGVDIRASEAVHEAFEAIERAIEFTN